MAKKRGLGRGLDSLIPPGSTPQAPGVTEIDTAAIMRNPRQPRAHMDEKQLGELAASIREHGVIQPLIVTRAPGDAYVLIAGERRLEAARLVGLTKVPVVVRDSATSLQLLELALVENIQRSDLSPLEAAVAYQTLADDFDLSHEEIARKVGKNRATISNTIRLLKLALPVQQALAEGEITEGHARALLSIRKHASQATALEKILKHGLNVRQTEELVRAMSGPRPAKTPAAKSSPEEADLENRFQASLGTKVRLRRNSKGAGTIIIHFYSDEELDALVERLLDM